MIDDDQDKHDYHHDYKYNNEDDDIKEMVLV